MPVIGPPVELPPIKEVPVNLPTGKIVVYRQQLIDVLEKANGFLEVASKDKSTDVIHFDDILFVFRDGFLEIIYRQEGIFVSDKTGIVSSEISGIVAILLPLSVMKKLKLMKGVSVSFIFSSVDIMANKYADPIVYSTHTNVTIEDCEHTRKSYLQTVDMSIAVNWFMRDAPELKEVATLPLKAFVDNLNDIAYAISTDQTKKHLTYINVELHNSFINLVTTDGMRLSYRQLKNPYTRFNDSATIMINKWLLKLLKNVKRDSAEIRISALNVANDIEVKIDIGKMTIRYKTYERYPPWRKIIPDKASLSDTYIEPKVMLDKLKTFRGLLDSPNAEQRFMLRRLVFDDYYEILEVNLDYEYEQGVACRFDIPVPANGLTPYTNIYNVKFFIEALEQLGDGKILVPAQQRAATLLSNEIDNILIMPVRISE